MQKSILLTGASGFLGSEIFKTLSQDFKVICLGRSNSDVNINLEINIPVFQDSFFMVVHCLGKAHGVPNNYGDIGEFHNVNVFGTINLLKGLEKTVIPDYFVYISSVSVYGLSEGYNVDENASLIAEDPYGKSKIESEKLIQKWCLIHNVKLTIFRLPLVIGNNPKGNLKNLIKGVKTGFYFNIAGGKAKKSMVLANDVAKFVTKAAEVGGIYNLTDGYHPSILELSENIANQLGCRKPLQIPYWLAKIIAFFGDIFGPISPFNGKKLIKLTSSLTFADSKARNAFGWKPNSVLDGFKLLN